MISRQVKEELNALSMEVFGASSRWQKLLDKGYSKVSTEKVTEFVPDDAHPQGGETREVEVPARPNGIAQSRIERHTVESVRALMMEMKAKRDAFLAEIKRRQEEEESKKAQQALQKQVNEDLMGSALT